MGCIGLLNFFLSLFVICSPFVAIPAMIALTKGQSYLEKKRVAHMATFAVIVILLGFGWAGTWVFSIMGIRLPALQIGGGGVVFLLGLSTLRSEYAKGTVGQSVAVVPLAIPLMAGPGAISQVIIAMEECPKYLDRVAISAMIVGVALLLGVCLRFSTWLEKWLGLTGIQVLSNLGGLLLLAIAVETIVKGVVGFFPALAMGW